MRLFLEAGSTHPLVTSLLRFALNIILVFHSHSSECEYQVMSTDFGKPVLA